MVVVVAVVVIVSVIAAAAIVTMDVVAMIVVVAVMVAVAIAQDHGWPFSSNRSSSESADRMMVVFSSSTFLYDSSVRRNR